MSWQTVITHIVAFGVGIGLGYAQCCREIRNFFNDRKKVVAILEKGRRLHEARKDVVGDAASLPRRRIPESFLPACWRGTTAMDKHYREIGFSLNCPDGAVPRFRLDEQSARHLAESLMEYLGDYTFSRNL